MKKNGSVKEDAKKVMDKKMLECINAELERLENATDIDQYREQIQNRKNGFNMFFTDFDFYINVLRDEKRFVAPRARNIGHKELLDRILKEKIIDKLEKVYKNAVILGEGSEELFNCKISQIVDRQRGIGEILDDYDGCMNILKRRAVLLEG